MRLVTVSGMVMMLLAVCFSPFQASATQYVQISESFVNVYKYLDPQSPVVKLAKNAIHLYLMQVGYSE